jgi:large subunit ribosomal protein L11
MAAKKIKTFIKLNIKAGAATAAPPVGPALGQHGVPIMDFVKAFNERTKEKGGDILPVVITVFEDRTFTFITKEPPIAEMIKKALKIEKGSGKPGKEFAGTLTKSQVEEIAKAKLPDLNTKNVGQAGKIVEGVARSMGVKVGA